MNLETDMITIRQCALLIALASACGGAAAQTGTATGAGGGTGMGDSATGDTGATGRSDSATPGTMGDKRKNADAAQKKSGATGAGAAGSSGTSGTSGSGASRPGAVSDSDPARDMTPGGVGASGTGIGKTATNPDGPSNPANADSKAMPSR